MTNYKQLYSLHRSWKGKNRLWLSSDEPARESTSLLEVSPTIQGQFLQLRYTWIFEEQPQEGMLLITITGESGALKALWLDSWHMREDFMVCKGTLTANVGFHIRGTYAAPPDLDWGWHITVELLEADKLRLRMHNQPPGAKAELAVDAVYTRM
jgi:hypothetical protein